MKDDIKNTSAEQTNETDHTPGMYAIADAPEGKVTIGEYELIRQGGDSSSIWVQHSSGEGAEFPEAKLAEVIDTFYKQNF